MLPQRGWRVFCIPHWLAHCQCIPGRQPTRSGTLFVARNCWDLYYLHLPPQLFSDRRRYACRSVCIQSHLIYYCHPRSDTVLLFVLLGPMISYIVLSQLAFISQSGIEFCRQYFVYNMAWWEFSCPRAKNDTYTIYWNILSVVDFGSFVWVSEY